VRITANATDSAIGIFCGMFRFDKILIDLAKILVIARVFAPKRLSQADFEFFETCPQKITIYESVEVAVIRTLGAPFCEPTC
jgi:hypothetical protein